MLKNKCYELIIIPRSLVGGAEAVICSYLMHVM